MFRNKVPQRRDRQVVVTHYSEHKPFLEEDFNKRCAYCDDINIWRMTWYEIDHFIPKKYLKTISDTDYENLVYSCRSCNNAKRAKWPTQSETIHNNGAVGFIDPCDQKYDQQFERNVDGSIKYNSTLGRWMFHALKLHKPQHAIIYKIQALNELIDEVEGIKYNKNTKIKDHLLKLYQKQREYILQLAETHN